MLREIQTTQHASLITRPRRFTRHACHPRDGSRDGTQRA